MGNDNEEVWDDETLLFKFSIGCIQFKPKNLSTRFDSVQALIRSLERSLNGIAAIQDIDIEHHAQMWVEDGHLPVPFPSLANGEFPYLGGGSGLSLNIDLRIAIPQRTQREILGRLDVEEIYDEIAVFFTYHYDLPLMVVAVPGDHGGKPSDCLYLVREFLKVEMEGNAVSEFTIDVLGPSPFHANFSVKEEISQRKPIIWRRRRRRGYDDFLISIPDQQSSIPDAIDHLQSIFLDEFDVYYNIILHTNQVRDSWYECLEKLHSLSREGHSVRFMNWVKEWLSPAVDLFELKSQVMDFRLLNADAMSLIEHRIRETASIEDSPIWSDISHAKSEFPKYDVDSVEKLVDFVNGKRTHVQNILNAILAAVVGGAAGAVASWLIATSH
jgi:hypothetical protein